MVVVTAASTGIRVVGVVVLVLVLVASDRSWQ